MGHEAHDGEDDKSCEHAGARVDTADDDGVPAERKGGVSAGWGALASRGARNPGAWAKDKGRGQERVPGSRAAGQVPHPIPGRDWNPEGVATGIGLDRNGGESGERPRGRGLQGAWPERKGLLGSLTCRHCCGKSYSSQERSGIPGPVHRRRRSGLLHPATPGGRMNKKQSKL